MTETHDSETDAQTAQLSTGRRAALAAVLSTVGLAGLTGQVSAQSGNVGTSSNPYQTAYVDTLTFVGRTSDPSSPSDGQMWYRSDK